MEKIRCILLVDDNQTSTFLNQQLIQKLNLAHQVLTARNGQLALDLLEQHQKAGNGYPELILVDLKMPVLDGFGFYKAFQQLEPEKQQAMKVVVLTTSLASVDIERARQAGIKNYITKPLTAQKLQAVWPQSIRKLASE